MAVVDQSGPWVREPDGSEIRRTSVEFNCCLTIDDRRSRARSRGELLHLNHRRHDNALDGLSDALILPASQGAERRQSVNMQRCTMCSVLRFAVMALIAAMAIIAVGETVHSQATERLCASQRELRPAR